MSPLGRESKVNSRPSCPAIARRENILGKRYRTGLPNISRWAH